MQHVLHTWLLHVGMYHNNLLHQKVTYHRSDTSEYHKNIYHSQFINNNSDAITYPLSDIPEYPHSMYRSHHKYSSSFRLVYNQCHTYTPQLHHRLFVYKISRNSIYSRDVHSLKKPNPNNCKCICHILL